MTSAIMINGSSVHEKNVNSRVSKEQKEVQMRTQVLAFDFQLRNSHYCTSTMTLESGVLSARSSAEFRSSFSGFDQSDCIPVIVILLVTFRAFSGGRYVNLSRFASLEELEAHAIGEVLAFSAWCFESNPLMPALG